jgi:SAM-dependent methyltransferase
MRSRAAQPAGQGGDPGEPGSGGADGPGSGGAVTDALTDPGDATLAAYEHGIQEYLQAGNPALTPELTAYLDQFAALAGSGPVLEIGSGPGWDADYLAARGVEVIRTDAAPAFVARLRAAGHDARLLDVRSGDLGGPYPGIFADAVLHHLSRDEFRDVLGRARQSVSDGGVLGFTIKEGDGAGWAGHKLSLPRHFTYWREPELRAALHDAGWAVISVTHVTRREDWLHIVARPAP